MPRLVMPRLVMPRLVTPRLVTPRFVMRLVSLAALATALAVPTVARAKVLATIIEWGEIEATTGPPLGPEYQEHGLGPGRELTASHYVNHDTTIPAQLCRGFGIHAIVTAGPNDTLPARILMRLRHPKLTRPDGASSEEDTLLVPLNSGIIGDAFTFDQPYEAQPGTWTFELVIGGDVIASQAFTIVPRDPGTPASLCASPPVS